MTRRRRLMPLHGLRGAWLRRREVSTRRPAASVAAAVQREMSTMSALGVRQAAASRWSSRSAPSLWEQLEEARRRDQVPEALRQRYAALRIAFEEVSGLMSWGVSTPDDIQRLRILDAIILELNAVEREIFLGFSDATPDAIRAAHSALLQRMSRAAAQPTEAERGGQVQAPTVLDLLRAGRPVSLSVRVQSLSPAGLMAMRQLLEHESGVQVAVESPLAHLLRGGHAGLRLVRPAPILRSVRRRPQRGGRAATAR